MLDRLSDLPARDTTVRTNAMAVLPTFLGRPGALARDGPERSVVISRWFVASFLLVRSRLG